MKLRRRSWNQSPSMPALRQALSNFLRMFCQGFPVFGLRKTGVIRTRRQRLRRAKRRSHSRGLARVGRRRLPTRARSDAAGARGAAPPSGAWAAARSRGRPASGATRSTDAPPYPEAHSRRPRGWRPHPGPATPEGLTNRTAKTLVGWPGSSLLQRAWLGCPLTACLAYGLPWTPPCQNRRCPSSSARACRHRPSPRSSSGTSGR
jgi:hypothetical protein